MKKYKNLFTKEGGLQIANNLTILWNNYNNVFK